MFDFFANWFGKKTVNETGQTLATTSSFRNGHFSLDLTFLVVVVATLLCCGAIIYFKRRLDARYRKKVKVILDCVEMQKLKTNPSSPLPAFNYPLTHLP
jgi:hypothetical protein